MTLSEREFWTVLHGLIYGSLYLLAFALVALGWLFTFPPFFELFASH